MKLSSLRERNFKIAIVVLMSLVQVYLLCKILSFDASTTLFVLIFFGFPIATVCGSLIVYKNHWRYVGTATMMFATGGLGMLLGYLVDVESLGLNGPFGLMSLCRTTADLPLNIDTLLLKLQTTPSMYIGMFVGGNLGMLLFDTIKFSSTSILGKFVYYTICNVGMLLGMLLADHYVMMISGDLNLYWQYVLMIASMHLGMVLGMILLLCLVERIRNKRPYLYYKVMS